MDDPVNILIPAAGAFLSLLCLWAAYRCGKRLWLVDFLPTSKTTGVFIGLVELKGTAEARRPLISHLAGRACVQYSWSVEEHWSRTVTETYRDSQGRTQTRTRRESGWRTVARGGEHIPFYLRDECGIVRVVPDKAELEPQTLFLETCNRSHPLYYAKGPRRAIPHSDHRRRFSETGIPVGAPLYIMGRARERADIVAPEIAHDPQAPMFLISTRSEEQVSRGLRWARRGWTLLGLLLVTGGFVVADLARDIDPATQWPVYLLAAGGFVIAAGLGWLWMVYNALIDLRNRVRRAWASIDVQLERRADLIPNLVGIVQGYRDHEQRAQAELAELRSQLAPTAPGQEGPDPHAVETVLVALKEKYPDLQAHPLFNSLQKNLVDTEHRIALARAYYNEIATHLRVRTEVIPDRFVARLAGIRPLPLLAAQGFEREPVALTLDEPVAEPSDVPGDAPETP